MIVGMSKLLYHKLCLSCLRFLDNYLDIQFLFSDLYLDI